MVCKNRVFLRFALASVLWLDAEQGRGPREPASARALHLWELHGRARRPVHFALTSPTFDTLFTLQVLRGGVCCRAVDLGSSLHIAR